MTETTHQTILIIDDEDAIRDVFSMCLTAEGYNVLMAEDGEKGIELFLQERPQVVITDLKMPGMDGIDVLKKIVAEDANTEVILCTGHGEMDIVIQALKIGAADFLVKPVAQQTLVDSVHKVFEKVEMRSALGTAKKQLVHAGQLSSLGTMAAGIAHELLQPLQSISNYNYLIRERHSELEIEDNDLQECYENIKFSINRMQSIVKHVKIFAKEDKGLYCDISLNDAVTNSLILINQKVKNCAISLRLNLDETLPNVNGNLRQIEQIAMNMFSNAIDAQTGNGSPIAETNDSERYIEVRSFLKDDYCHVQWENNGPEIPPEVKLRIFDPFYTTKGEGDGMGLGLSMCFSISRNHKGSLTVISDPQKTVFTLKIPRF